MDNDEDSFYSCCTEIALLRLHYARKKQANTDAKSFHITLQTRTRSINLASTHHYLEVYGLRVRCHRRLLKSFRQCWVRVNRPRNVLTACSVLDCQRRFRDHLTRVRSNDMNA